jgi:hypothetical protein
VGGDEEARGSGDEEAQEDAPAAAAAAATAPSADGVAAVAGVNRTREEGGNDHDAAAWNDDE